MIYINDITRQLIAVFLEPRNIKQPYRLFKWIEIWYIFQLSVGVWLDVLAKEFQWIASHIM